MVSVLLVAGACSKSTSTTTSTTSPATTTAGPATSSPPAPETSAPSSPEAVGDLSGTWKGRYSGDYQGTFTLTWSQSGSRLSGTIELSSFSGTLPINGTVNGSDISFGTVGSTAITYTGSVSGDSMSGTYQVQAPGGASSGGPWSASKSS